VGKTSIGQSIARAMGRRFARISLGGVHDEAEIRGHRRTYIGALPGTIIQSIRKTGSRNPVFMLDEVDKLSASFHGDPASALLEVLDPEQNATFRDNYLGVPFDLSQVMFIGTANVIDAIPGPLRDRCEVIEMPGYTEEEKIQIARRYLVKRRLEENGLTQEYCEITDDAIRDIVRYYTREAGCRNLERTIGSVCRSVATRLAEVPVEARGKAGGGAGEAASAGTVEPPERGEGPKPSPAPVTGLPPPSELKKAQPGLELPIRVDAEDLHSILGSRKFESEVAMRTSISGVATGLAWTPTGGTILFVEATRMPGKGQLILTGQLGDIMKESAQAAISLVKSRGDSLQIDGDAFEKTDIHVHVPAGSIPKDGPSAGVAIYTALVSLLTGKQVRSDIAMTGEISLRGLVLPVGGIKEKVLAAHRAGIFRVFLPARNRKDFEDIPAGAREKLSFVWLENVDEAISLAILEEAPLPGAPVSPH
jgi:ATP-dependent Lon protease